MENFSREANDNYCQEKNKEERGCKFLIVSICTGSDFYITIILFYIYFILGFLINILVEIKSKNDSNLYVVKPEKAKCKQFFSN